MRLYRLDYSDADNGTVVEWMGTQREFKARRRELEADGVTVYDVPSGLTEIPLNKDGLVWWLNANFTSDNG